jgi:altered-inheritance-of-mitochondria protein 13
VRSKISAEAARLRGHNNNNGEGEGGVDIVQREIEAALERENLDRERRMAGEAGANAEAGAEAESGPHGGGDIKNSTALLGDLEEVRQKVEKYHARERASCYQYVLSPSCISLLFKPLLTIFVP